MVLISPSQVESQIIEKIKQLFGQRSRQLHLTILSTFQEIVSFFQQNRVDCVCLSTAYEPIQMLEIVSTLARVADKQAFLFSLIYLIDWKTPLPTLLGTHWANNIGVLHTLSSEHEITALFDRLHSQTGRVGAVEYQPRQ